MTVVVDANILIAFGLADEPLHTQVKAILLAWQTAKEHLTAPRLFRSEITAVVRKAAYQQRLTVEQGRAMLSQLLHIPSNFMRMMCYLKKPMNSLSVSTDLVPMTPSTWPSPSG